MQTMINKQIKKAEKRVFPVIIFLSENTTRIDNKKSSQKGKPLTKVLKLMP